MLGEEAAATIVVASVLAPLSLWLSWRRWPVTTLFVGLIVLWSAAAVALLYGAARTREDYSGAFTAAIAGATALVAGALAALTADIRLTKQLAAERQRARELSDVEDLRDVVQQAARAHDQAFTARRWSPGDADKARAAILEILKAHNRLLIRDAELAASWRTAYEPYIESSNYKLIGPDAAANGKHFDPHYTAFLDAALLKTQTEIVG